MNKYVLIIFVWIIVLTTACRAEGEQPSLPSNSTDTSGTVSLTGILNTTEPPELTVTMIPTRTTEPTATPTPKVVICDRYFEAIHPAIIVPMQGNIENDPFIGARSILLLKSRTCPLSIFENMELHIFINGQEIIADVPFTKTLMNNQGGDDRYLRLDYDQYTIPESDELEIVVQDQDRHVLFSDVILNIAQTGIFKIPKFVNVRNGTDSPIIFEKGEIRVYHVDSIPLLDGEVTSSFNIGDVKDVKDQCSKPDGIHPEFIHWNAIDYGRCEGGPGSTNYEVWYMGPYPITVRDIHQDNSGISVIFNFAFDQVPNPPLFVIEHQEGRLEKYYLVLKYHHLSEVFVEIGENIPPGTLIGLIGKSQYNTELHEERGVTKDNFSDILSPEAHSPIPYKLTLSQDEGNWIESLINEFNGR